MQYFKDIQISVIDKRQFGIIIIQVKRMNPALQL